MSVVVTVRSGFDLEYYTASAAKEPEHSPGGYYINASIQGEAPGHWFGPGCRSLGLTGNVSPQQFRQVYSLADPTTGERLGGPRRAFTRSYHARLAQLRAAEPHATADRVHELEHQARQDTRQSPAYTDVTLNFSKSISLLHGSIRENAARARNTGDLAAAAWWDDRDARYCEILQQANTAAMEHMQTWAGVTRTGYHGRMVNHRELGRWEPAELVGTSWLQSTSRDGEMHDHIHNPVLPRVRTLSDGKWRATDTMAIRRQIPAIQATAAAYVEAALSREFGVKWMPRPDGMGNEIQGVTQEEIDAFSSRRNSVTAKQAELAAEFARKYGRVPNQRELLSIHRTAWAVTREAKPDEPIDFDAAAREWGAEWERIFGAPLAVLASRVSNMRGPRYVSPPAPASARLEAPTLDAAARVALARVQSKNATWTRADLMRQIKASLPATEFGIDPEAAVRLVNELTDRTLAGEFEPVQCLEAPELVALPGSLCRSLDGRSICTRPGSVRYATRVQLSLEERLVASAQRQTQARLTREQAAVQFGADADVLSDQLSATTGGADSDLTRSGLRMDQAAALFYALTSTRTAEVLVGPAGSGKTRALAEAARAWRATTGGRVIGLTTSQSARNVLVEAGVNEAENTSSFLGHLPGRRGALGIRANFNRGALLMLDEASMTSTSDLADITDFAVRNGHKVLIAGDQEQLAAVEGGGGMMLLANHLGSVQLTEAVRFSQGWERAASLGLRGGEVSALEAYDRHGRITGDEPDLALDRASSAYLGSCLAGRDVLLIAHAHETCRELSRRIRDDLLHLGLVDDSRTAKLREGARAGAGDVIVARVNDHDLEAGETGRTLANGDVMKVVAVNDDGSLTVRRRTDRDPQTGQADWSNATFPFADAASTDLGYAVTGHAAQGLTVSHGITVVTGSEGRQWLYSAMTRGADLNQAVVFTQPAAPANPAAGTRAAPELGRHHRVAAERAGEPPPGRYPGSDPDPREPMAVLVDVVARDEAQEAALDVLLRELGDADHLAILEVMWHSETIQARRDSWRDAIRRALPSEYRGAQLDGGTSTWLWRTLRSVEAAGLDPEQVAVDAVASAPLTGVRDVAAVIDARIRRATAGLAPAVWRPWSERVPAMADPVRQQFVTELAALMDARRERIGEHAVHTQPVWAGNALGPVPNDPVDRLDWQQRASAIGAYRELYGIVSDTEPIGPEPVNSPEASQAWMAAYGAQLHQNPSSLEQLPDSSLLLRRAQYEAETAWAPPYAGRELRQVRMAHLDMATREVLHEAEAEAARTRGDQLAADKHGALAQSAATAASFYRERAELDEQLDKTRQQWDAHTAPTRLQAIQADAVLRRRRPNWNLAPIASAEPDPLPDELPAFAATEAERHRSLVAASLVTTRTEIEFRTGVLVPSEDSDLAPEGEAWPDLSRPRRDAILQPPKLPMSAPRLVQREVEYEPQA